MGAQSPFGGGDLAETLGLLHDAGKADCAWQERLLEVEGSGLPVGRDHKSLGTRMACRVGAGSGPRGLGQDAEHDVQSDVEVDGAEQGVGAEETVDLPSVHGSPTQIGCDGEGPRDESRGPVS